MAIYISMECQRERIVNEPEAKPKNEEFEIIFRRRPVYMLDQDVGDILILIER